ncbi:prolyl 4-hydroxylase subunit alpha-1-like isoform X2 [Stylophora pistillata]|uniref:prolyl 4-hydroxylase subunit alpha-1-like isoform X2 n=1 Tax=Stylophora pistillata TaxID=50429 RepID=UPI000C0453AD|nr:prolyl 4-hydroxylase subunit alpha-1-like isoform X2 [Stylophora pistillata]
MIKWKTWMVWLSLILSISTAELFTSLSRIKGLVRLESALSNSLDNYLEQMSEPPEVLQQFSDQVRKERDIAAGDIEKYAFHPINSFLLVRRFVRHWTELATFLSKGSPNDLYSELMINRRAFPTPKDFMGSLNAILRIQEIYNLSASALADGDLHQAIPSGGLGADECYELGIGSSDQKNYEGVIGWMKEALKRMSPPYEYSGALIKIDVLEYLAWAEYKVGLLEDAIIHTKDILDEDPTSKQAHVNLGHFEAEMIRRSTNVNHSARNKVDNKTNRKDNKFKYERLCRGETRKSQRQRDKLSCYYNRNRPTQVLRPVKVEMLNSDPDLYLFHDFISESEIELVKRLAKPQLKRAVVTDTDTGKEFKADYRISQRLTEPSMVLSHFVILLLRLGTRYRMLCAQSAWLDDHDSPIVKRISQRIQTITGLSLDSEHSEALQVANYGIAGHYDPHHDFLQNPDGSLPSNVIDGDRIATVLFYMSDVEAGGATVFLDAEEIVYPRKGDAIFWYNLKKDGSPDVKTMHAACPVIIGSKWVANKWINERGQEFRRPCIRT